MENRASNRLSARTFKDESRGGFSIVDVVVAVAIITFALAGLMTVAQASLRIVGDATERLKASFLLEEGVEALKRMRDRDWTNLSSLLTDGTNYGFQWNGSEWISQGTPDVTDGRFTRMFKLETVYRDAGTKDIMDPCDAACQSANGPADADVRKATVTVSWPGRRGTMTKNLKTYILNISSP
jgi:Tfp pilus assembly protein PilV